MRNRLLFFLCLIALAIFGDGVRGGTIHQCERCLINAAWHDSNLLMQFRNIRHEVKQIRGILDIENMDTQQRLRECATVARRIRKTYDLPISVAFRLVQMEFRARRKA